MSDDTALAVAAHLESLLPSADDLAAHLSAPIGPGRDMGPTVTLPAVYVRIVTTAFRAAILEQRHAAMRAVIDDDRLKPAAALTDEQFTQLSLHLIKQANAGSHEPIEGAAALWNAASIMALAHMPSEAVLSALDQMHAITRADVAQAIGVGATKQ